MYDKEYLVTQIDNPYKDINEYITEYSPSNIRNNKGKCSICDNNLKIYKYTEKSEDINDDIEYKYTVYTCLNCKYN